MVRSRTHPSRPSASEAVSERCNQISAVSNHEGPAGGLHPSRRAEFIIGPRSCADR